MSRAQLPRLNFRLHDTTTLCIQGTRQSCFVLFVPDIIGLPALMKCAKENVYVGGDNALAGQWPIFTQAGFKD